MSELKRGDLAMDTKEVKEKAQEILERARSAPLPCVQTYQAEGESGLRICGREAMHTDGQWIYCSEHAPFLKRPVRFISDDERVALVLVVMATSSPDRSGSDE